MAKCVVHIKHETFRMIQDKEISKGGVLGVAKTAGIMAAKKTHDLIPR